jgi:hypothetical protein
MADFPQLKTGAVAQYPAARETAYSTWVGRFVDGREQRFRQYPAPLKRWLLTLELLTEEEVERFRVFFREMQGESGEFRFRDPWDGVWYEHCSLEGGSLAALWREEGQAELRLVVRQKRI